MAAEPAQGDDFYVVGIGASAGGLAALRTLFSSMPHQPGYACVIVLHLSPEHESHLVELLQPYTSMPVQQVRRTVPLRPNHVYVIPPNANLDTIDTHLRLSELEARRSERATIDHFLRTLAATHDGHAIAVILTGTGSDGALGIRQIKERAGLTISQDPAEAEHDSMPRSAIATGTVDLVLPLRKVPEEIARYCATRPQLPTPGSEHVAAMAELRPGIDGIIEQLALHTRQDFSVYNHAPLLRRVRHRMQLRHIEALAGYVELLRAEPEEAHALKRDLLLHVTEFFQDSELYQLLEERLLPDIFAGRPKRVRIWSIGCATGEEAYSLAMLLIEQSERFRTAAEVQVFASDVSDDALRRARFGLYPHEIAGSISSARLARFFVPEGPQFRVRQDVRDRVVFAAHNVFRDPPYSHLNLILCRSMLCELQPEVRLALFNLFFYALEEGGVLIVGSKDEMDVPELFVADRTATNVFHRRPGMRRELGPAWLRVGTPRSASVGRGQLLGNLNRPTDELYRTAIERYAPPTVLIDAAGEVLRFSGRAHSYVRMPGGGFTNTLGRMLPPSIRVRLEAGLAEVHQTGRAWASEVFAAEMASGSQRELVLRVDPLESNAADERFLVVFDEQLTGTLARELSAVRPRSLSGFETELAQTKARLGDMLASEEELRCQPVHAELRATIEQLEASYEELRTVTDELTTLDIENRGRIAALAQTSDDLRNILESTGVATVVLDQSLRIMRFTEPAAQLLQLSSRDVGRHLPTLRNLPKYQDIEEEAERVLAHQARVDREVAGVDGRWYLSRMLPYRARGFGVEGVVISFIDISDRKRAEAALRESEEQQRLTVELVPALLWWTDASGADVAVNYRWKYYTGQTHAEVQNLGWLAMIHPEDLAATRAAFEHAFATGESLELQARVREVGDYYRWHLVRHVPIRNDDGTIGRWFGAAVDVDESHQLQDRQQLLVAELQHRTRNLITLVRALSERTLSNAPSLQVFKEKFNRRLSALSRVQGLFAHLAPGETVTFDHLLGAELAALGAPEDKVTLDGPAGVPLRATSVQVLALALHELATNAVKYGALSPSGGHLDVCWHVEPGSETGAAILYVEWRERGVAMPKADEADRGSGYGRELIERALPYQLRAKTTFVLGSDGVRCTIAVPVPAVATLPKPSS